MKQPATFGHNMSSFMKLLIALLMAFPALPTIAQQRVHFGYDASGNRVSRLTVQTMQAAKRSGNNSPERIYIGDDMHLYVTVGPNPTTRLVSISITGRKKEDK